MPPSAPEAPTVLAVGAPNARRAAAGPCHGVASAAIPTAAGGAAVLPEGVWRTSCGGDREARGHRPQKDSGPRSPSRDSETASRPEAAAQSRKQDTRAAAPRHHPRGGRGRGRPPPPELHTSSFPTSPFNGRTVRGTTAEATPPGPSLLWGHGAGEPFSNGLQPPMCRAAWGHHAPTRGTARLAHAPAPPPQTPLVVLAGPRLTSVTGRRQASQHL